MKTCRACNKLTTSVTSLFYPDTKELFEKCTYLKVILGDTLPSNICNICLQQCKLWQEFQKMCQNNDTLLRVPLSPVKLNQNMGIIINTSDSTNELASFDTVNNLNFTNVDIDDNLTEERSKSTIILPIDMKKVKKKKPKTSIELYEPILDDIIDLENDSSFVEEVYAEIKTNFTCYQCNFKFQTIQSLRNHLIDIHLTYKPLSESNQSKPRKRKRPNVENNDKSTIKEYKCRKCPQVYRSSASRLMHELVHGERTKICSYCGLGFFTTYKLTQHIRIHTNERPFKCKYCPKAFKRGLNLKVHIRMHTNERPYKCNLCTNAYFNNQSLKLHYKMHNKNVELKYSCELCDMKFSHIRFCNLHKQNIHNVNSPTQQQEQPKELQCEDCPRVFKFQSLLSKHRRFHTNERPFKCKLCPKNYRQTHQLSTHILRIHKMTRQEYNNCE